MFLRTYLNIYYYISIPPLFKNFKTSTHNIIKIYLFIYFLFLKAKQITKPEKGIPTFFLRDEGKSLHHTKSKKYRKGLTLSIHTKSKNYRKGLTLSNIKKISISKKYRKRNFF